MFRAIAFSFVIVTLAIVNAACDKLARVEVNNETNHTIVVTVNGRNVAEIEADERVCVGPGVNERLRTLTVVLRADPRETETLTLNTYDGDLVLYVSGPPLKLEMAHADHPSATRTPTD